MTIDAAFTWVLCIADPPARRARQSNRKLVAKRDTWNRRSPAQMRRYRKAAFLAPAIYNFRAGNVLPDAMAALTVAIVALPLSMAIAVASGVSPERGLYTAVIGGFLVSALGGSRPLELLSSWWQLQWPSLGSRASCWQFCSPD
jgi:Sulfate permease family